MSWRPCRRRRRSGTATVPAVAHEAQQLLQSLADRVPDAQHPARGARDEADYAVEQRRHDLADARVEAVAAHETVRRHLKRTAGLTDALLEAAVAGREVVVLQDMRLVAPVGFVAVRAEGLPVALDDRPGDVERDARQLVVKDLQVRAVLQDLDDKVIPVDHDGFGRVGVAA